MKKKWKLVIEDKNSKVREYPLDHEYETESEAEREAEDIADQVYEETDIGWSVIAIKNSAIAGKLTCAVCHKEIPITKPHFIRDGKIYCIACKPPNATRVIV